MDVMHPGHVRGFPKLRVWSDFLRGDASGKSNRHWLNYWFSFGMNEKACRSLLDADTYSDLLISRRPRALGPDGIKGKFRLATPQKKTGDRISPRSPLANLAGMGARLEREVSQNPLRGDKWARFSCSIRATSPMPGNLTSLGPKIPMTGYPNDASRLTGWLICPVPAQPGR